MQLRRPVVFVHHRVRLDSGTSQEIDILASLGGDMWVCQSKWETTRKVGVAVVKELLGHAKAVQKEYEPPVLRTWIFAHEGLTKGALDLPKKEDVLWSNREQLDALLSYLELRKLPSILDQ